MRIRCVICVFIAHRSRAIVILEVERPRGNALSHADTDYGHPGITTCRVYERKIPLWSRSTVVVQRFNRVSRVGNKPFPEQSVINFKKFPYINEKKILLNTTDVFFFFFFNRSKSISIARTKDTLESSFVSLFINVNPKMRQKDFYSAM